MMTKLLLHEEIRTIDIPAIANYYSNNKNAFEECMLLIEIEIQRIKKNPEGSGAKCVFEPLSSRGFRKVKLFSSRSDMIKKRVKPDLRIIYLYDTESDSVFIHTIAFRIKERPRPKNDAYSIAQDRVIPETLP